MFSCPGTGHLEIAHMYDRMAERKVCALTRDRRELMYWPELDTLVEPAHRRGSHLQITILSPIVVLAPFSR